MRPQHRAQGGAARRAVLAELERRLARLEAEHGGPGRAAASRGQAPGLGPIDDCFTAGGLPMAAVHEMWTDEPSARSAVIGFAIALAGHLARARRGPRAGGDLVWAYPRHGAREWGLPYGPGLMAFGHDPGRFILVEAPGAIEALWAGEEALRTGAAAGVVIALDGGYARHAFTASRRLELAARAGAAGAFLLCAGDAATSAASLRWRVAPVRGGAPAMTQAAAQGPAEPFPARPRWHVVLERNRLGRGGSWIVEWNHERATLAASTAGCRARPQPSAGAHAGAVAGALAGRTGTQGAARQRRPAPGARRSA